METSTMKILLTSAALATAILAASPVSAQEERSPSARALAQHQAVLRGLPRERAMLRRVPNAVFDGREFVGADPDAFIRNDLIHSDNRGD
jgi:hypothetical protein